MPYIVVCYDIVENRTRTRVMKRLKEYLPHVQKSVFEGEISEPDLQKMRQVVESELDLLTDTVRIYRLCRRCVPSTEIIGLGEYVESEDADEII